MPGLTDRIRSLLLVDSQFGRTPAAPGDNLNESATAGEVRGDHQGSTIRPSVYTNLALRPVALATIVAMTVAGLATVAWRGRGSSKGLR